MIALCTSAGPLSSSFAVAENESCTACLDQIHTGSRSWLRSTLTSPSDCLTASKPLTPCLGIVSLRERIPGISDTEPLVTRLLPEQSQRTRVRPRDPSPAGAVTAPRGDRTRSAQLPQYLSRYTEHLLRRWLTRDYTPTTTLEAIALQSRLFCFQQAAPPT